MSQRCKQKGCQNERSGSSQAQPGYCLPHTFLRAQANQAKLDFSRLDVARDLIYCAESAGISHLSGTWLPEKNELGYSAAFRPVHQAGEDLWIATRNLRQRWRKEHAERVAKACEKRSEDE